MGIYVKKPIQVRAEQWDGTDENAFEITAWVNGEAPDTALYQPAGELISTGGDYVDPGTVLQIEQVFVIRTREGFMTVSVGDFIIRGVQGEFYPCKPDIFAATYEAVPDAS